MNENLIYKKFCDYENYLLCANGTVKNIITNKEVLPVYYKKQYIIYFCKNNTKKNLAFLRVMYELFYNVKLTANDIIKFKNEKLINKFSYTNLEKINRKDMIKNEPKIKLNESIEWKIIKNYPHYKISEFGDIYSAKTNKLMKLKLNLYGYFIIKLTNYDGEKNMYIHRVVYDTFKSIIDNTKVIDHIDRNKQNNHISNLREITVAENNKNCNRQKPIPAKIHQYSLNNKFIKEWNSFSEIRNELSICTDNIMKCCLGKRDSSNGFIWKNCNIITYLKDFVVVNTQDNNKFSNYKINKNGIIINKHNMILKFQLLVGYYKISLINDERKKINFFVHRLIALTFLKNPNNHAIINHKDKNKMNNKIENLEWVTHTQNITHSQGKKIEKINPIDNKILKIYNSINEIARDLNKSSKGNIDKALSGQRKTAYGFIWKYSK
jgi:hypothetical protein